MVIDFPAIASAVWSHPILLSVLLVPFIVAVLLSFTILTPILSRTFDKDLKSEMPALSNLQLTFFDASKRTPFYARWVVSKKSIFWHSPKVEAYDLRARVGPITVFLCYVYVYSGRVLLAGFTPITLFYVVETYLIPEFNAGPSGKARCFFHLSLFVFFWAFLLLPGLVKSELLRKFDPKFKHVFQQLPFRSPLTVGLDYHRALIYSLWTGCRRFLARKDFGISAYPFEEQVSTRVLFICRVIAYSFIYSLGIGMPYLLYVGTMAYFHRITGTFHL